MARPRTEQSGSYVAWTRTGHHSAWQPLLQAPSFREAHLMAMGSRAAVDDGDEMELLILPLGQTPEGGLRHAHD